MISDRIAVWPVAIRQEIFFVTRMFAPLTKVDAAPLWVVSAMPVTAGIAAHKQVRTTAVCRVQWIVAPVRFVVTGRAPQCSKPAKTVPRIAELACVVMVIAPPSMAAAPAVPGIAGPVSAAMALVKLLMKSAFGVILIAAFAVAPEDPVARAVLNAAPVVATPGR